LERAFSFAAISGLRYAWAEPQEKCVRKRHSFSWIGMSALLATALPLMAQAPDIHQIYAYPPIHIANAPANPGSPTGILPVQYKAAYGFNQVPN
jgi:hypothetical protein